MRKSTIGMISLVIITAITVGTITWICFSNIEKKRKAIEYGQWQQEAQKVYMQQQKEIERLKEAQKEVKVEQPVKVEKTPEEVRKENLEGHRLIVIAASERLLQDIEEFYSVSRRITMGELKSQQDIVNYIDKVRLNHNLTTVQLKNFAETDTINKEDGILTLLAKMSVSLEQSIQDTQKAILTNDKQLMNNAGENMDDITHNVRRILSEAKAAETQNK